MSFQIRFVAEVLREHEEHRKEVLRRREEKKVETARRNLQKRAEKAKGLLPSFKRMLERPGFGICSRCLTEKPEVEMGSTGTWCRSCMREYSWQQSVVKRGGLPRVKLTDEELAARSAARQKAKSKTGWTTDEVSAYKSAKTAMVEVTKKAWFSRPKRFSHNGKVFDTELERDEYVRGWREYKEWCEQNREAIKRAAQDRKNEARLLKNATDAGFSTIEEYQQWIANKPHPLKKSDEHHAERRRIRDQWRNYRKQVKSGMGANGGRIPSGWFKEQLHRQDHCCAICRLPFGDGDVEIDHIVPVAKGGPNVAWNLQLTHPVCNIQKSDLLPWEFKVAA